MVQRRLVARVGATYKSLSPPGRGVDRYYLWCTCLFLTPASRSVYGSARSGWHLEEQRLGRLGKSPWNPHNDVLSAWAISAVLFAALTAAFGVEALPYLAVQAVLVAAGMRPDTAGRPGGPGRG